MIIITMGITAAVFIAAVPPMEGQGNLKLTFERSDTLQKALKKFKAQNGGAAPANLSTLMTTTGVPCNVDTNSNSSTYKQLIGWCGPYIDQAIVGAALEYQTDGWGKIFQYNGTSIVSCGPDRNCGNSDDLTFTGF